MKTKATLLALALLLCAGAFVAFTLSRPGTVGAPATADEHFGKINYSPMPVDTFIRQLQLAYGESLQVKKEETEIRLQWQPANGNPSSFYNFNEELPGVHGHGFTLQVEEQRLQAAFRISNGVVNVPNDVLLSLLRQLPKNTPS